MIEFYAIVLILICAAMLMVSRGSLKPCRTVSNTVQRTKLQKKLMREL